MYFKFDLLFFPYTVTKVSLVVLMYLYGCTQTMKEKENGASNIFAVLSGGASVDQLPI